MIVLILLAALAVGFTSSMEEHGMFKSNYDEDDDW